MMSIVYTILPEDICYISQIKLQISNISDSLLFSFFIVGIICDKSFLCIYINKTKSLNIILITICNPNLFNVLISTGKLTIYFPVLSLYIILAILFTFYFIRPQNFSDPLTATQTNYCLYIYCTIFFL